MKKTTRPIDSTIDEVGALLRNARNLLVIGHIAPDGDAVGSVLALTLGLRQLGKRCLPACADPIPEEFDFLPGVNQIAAHPPKGDEDLIVVLDSSDVHRIGGLYVERLFSQIPTLNIDHHVTNTRYGDWNLIRDTAATAEIIYDLLRWLDVEIDRDIATCLLAGIVTDTRSFRTPNTNASTLRLATELVERGASLAEVTDRLCNRRPLANIRLWAEALSRAQLRGRILWTEITREMMRRTGATHNDSGGIVNFLASANEADVGVVFREMDDGQIDCAFRSSPGTDVAKIALALGGGGHPQASGCVVSGDLVEVRERVLAALEDSLKEQMKKRATVASRPDHLKDTLWG